LYAVLGTFTKALAVAYALATSGPQIAIADIQPKGYGKTRSTIKIANSDMESIITATLFDVAIIW